MFISYGVIKITVLKILCPQNWNESRITPFLTELEHAITAAELTIDFSPLQFANPFATLLVAREIRNVVRYRFATGLETKAEGVNPSVNAVSYLGHVGFFQFTGIDFGNKPNQAKGSSRYLPITIIKREELQHSKLRIQEQIKKRSRQLALIALSGSIDDSYCDVLTYSFTEAIRNVFEHANTDECIIMAQGWDGGVAEIAIADEGRGLLASLSESHVISTEKMAISEAIKPGISRITEPENDDDWQNSGFGLYVISELGRRFGSFSLGSGNNLLLIIDRWNFWYPTPGSGTALKLRVKISEPEYFPNILQTIVDEGEQKAASITGARKTASKMSKSSTHL